MSDLLDQFLGGKSPSKVDPLDEELRDIAAARRSIIMHNTVPPEAVAEAYQSMKGR